MRFTLTVLGSSSAQPTPTRHHSAHLLNVHEQYYLIDCGEGTQSRLLKAGINPMKINAVFISHLHGDHLYGLFPMISTLGLMGRKTPLQIYAPRPFGEILAQHRHYFETDLPFEIQYHEVDTRENALIYENKVMEVWSIPLRHRVPTAGYLFREKHPAPNVRKEKIEQYGLSIAQIVAAKHGEDILLEQDTFLPTDSSSDNNATAADPGCVRKQQLISNAELTYRPYEPRSYAYLSDTLYSAKAATLVRGLDLLYHEATFADEEKALARQTGHSTASQAAKAALVAEASRLLIGHFSGRYKEVSSLVEEARAIFPNTEAVEEGKTYPIPPKLNPA